MKETLEMGELRFSRDRAAADYKDPGQTEEETAGLEEFLREGNLVRIVRTFEPFPEPSLPELRIGIILDHSAHASYQGTTLVAPKTSLK